ncbi:NAD(P)/FAD-dependent oxidoreductase [Lentilactobacillus sp. Marseille-Q4993]|uniref:dihydrolipoyl dehydrogenase family protein n=1 Tax=Lentilactobacillus sp. Marseille-Q4993 TaxID=3039492 RepID=UPI0024BD0FCB|nr:NAD(P)/FAD-dependent oxidoreductase [Lentilactobacillus sp. Marseille-Q4993]
MTQKKVDIIVIGAGPGGLAAAHGLNSSKSVLVVENDLWGGTCPNRGCDPKKMLYSIIHTKKQGEFLKNAGLICNPGINWEEMMAFKSDYTSKIPTGTLNGLNRSNITTEHGSPKFISENEIEVNDTIYEADKFIIATGLKPVIPDIPGAELLQTSTDFLQLPSLPKNIAFIGGGFVSIELANIANESGAKVHIIQHNDRVLKEFPKEFANKIVEMMKANGVEFHFDTEVSEVKNSVDKTYKVIGSNGLSLNVNAVFSAMGRRPDLQSLNLEMADVESDNRGIIVNDHLQTTNPIIYAVGDVIKKTQPKLTPVASFEGRYVASDILNSDNDKIQYPSVPEVVYSTSELAQVGIRVADAEQQPDKYQIKNFDVGNWYTFNRIKDPNAYVQTIIDKSNNQIVGATVVSMLADELINYFAIAIDNHQSAGTISNMITAYPTPASDMQYYL